MSIRTACGKTAQKPETGIRIALTTPKASSDQPRKAGRVPVRAYAHWTRPPRIKTVVPNVTSQKAVSRSN
jgi:hypothetical protein